jgi:hypothetical protein
LRWKSRRFTIPAGAALSGLAAVAIAVGAPPMMTVHTGAKLRVLKPSSSSVVTANSVATAV